MNYETIDAMVDSKRGRELEAARAEAKQLSREQRKNDQVAERVANSLYAPLVSRNRALVEQATAINDLWTENGYFTYQYTPGYGQHSSVRVGPTLVMGKVPGNNVVSNPILRWEAWDGRSDHTAELAFSVVDDGLLAKLAEKPLSFLHVFDDDNPDSRREKSFTINLENPAQDHLAELAAARAPRFKFSPGFREAIDFTRLDRKLTSLEQAMQLMASAALNDELNPFWANRATETGVANQILGNRQPLPIEELAYKNAYTKQEYLQAARACLSAGELHLIPYFTDTGLVNPKDLQPLL